MTLALGCGLGLPFCAGAGGASGPRPFKMTIDTTVAGGVTANDQYQVSTLAGETYNATIDWGDTNQTTLTTDTPPVHTYAAPGTYQISISGIFPAFDHQQTDDGNKVVSVDQFGDIVWSTWESFMYHTDFMEMLATDIPNLSGVTLTENAFNRSYSMTGNASMNNWDTSNITDMYGFFQFSQGFNIYIGDWDVSNVTDFGIMFEWAIVYNQPVTNWDTSSMARCRYMFANSAFSHSVAHFNIQNLVDAFAFMAGTGMSTVDYDATLNSWSAQADTHTVDNVTVHFGTSTYSPAGAAAHANLLSRGWTISDGGPV